MADERRETLIRMFPEYDVDTLLASMTTFSTEQIADWCLNNPTRVPMKRKGEKRKHPDPAQSPGSGQDSDSDLEFDDIADGLILDRLVKEFLNKLKKEMSQQNNKSEATSNEVKYVLSAVYPTLRMDFIKIAYTESGYRLCAALIICFFVSNKLTQRLRDAMLNPQSNMWVMTDTVKSARKKVVLDIFDGDISHYGETVTTPIKKFVTMINALSEKYPLIINRLQLLPDAFQLRLDVPDDIEKFECGVCFCEYTVTHRIVCGIGKSSDSHFFCRTCVKQQATAATQEMPLAEGAVGLKCMAYDCNNPILYSAVRNLIPKNIRRKIDERIMEENIGNSGLNLERCRDCNFAIEMEESKEENKVFSCPNCEQNWCRLCERPWDNEHFGLSCAEVDEKNKVDKKQRELERKLNEAVIRKCKCGLQFTKSEGCNKMTCRCGKTQCYLCRQEGINYTHFCQHVRNPGIQQCHHCDKKCTLWADANQLDQQLLNRILTENGEAPDPNAPGPSGARNRQPSPPLPPLLLPPNRPNFARNYVPLQMPPMAYGLQQQFVPQPMQMQRHHHFNAMPEGFNFGYNNGPINFNVNIENPPHYIPGYRNFVAGIQGRQQQNRLEPAEEVNIARARRAEREPVQQIVERALEQNANQPREAVRDRAERRREILFRHGARVMPERPVAQQLEADEQQQRLRRRHRDEMPLQQGAAIGGDEQRPRLRAAAAVAEEAYQQKRRAERERQKREEARPRIERHIHDLGRLLENTEARNRNENDLPNNVPRNVDILNPRQQILERIRYPRVTFEEAALVPRGRNPPPARNNQRNEELEDALDYVRRFNELDNAPLQRNEELEDALDYVRRINELDNAPLQRNPQPVPKKEAREDPPWINFLQIHYNERDNVQRDRPAQNIEPLNEYVQNALRDYAERNNAPVPRNQPAQNNETIERNVNQNAGQVRHLNFIPRAPEPLIPPAPQRHHRIEFQPDLAAQRQQPRVARRRTPVRINLFDLPAAQNFGPVGGNADLNNEMPRFVNINIGHNNMVNENQVERIDIRVGPAPPVQQPPIIHQHEPIVGRPINALNDMEPLRIEQNIFEQLEQPDIEIEEIPFPHLVDIADSLSSEEDSSLSSDDGDEIDAAPGVDAANEEEQFFEEEGENQQQQQPQIPIEIDLTGELEDDTANQDESDIRQIKQIRDKGERFEVMPIDLNSYVQETKKIDNDWNYVYKLIADLQATNQKMRESLAVNDAGNQPEKSQAILGTLDRHDEIASFIMQKMPELNAQTEKFNTL